MEIYDLPSYSRESIMPFCPCPEYFKRITVKKCCVSFIRWRLGDLNHLTDVRRNTLRNLIIMYLSALSEHYAISWRCQAAGCLILPGVFLF